MGDCRTLPLEKFVEKGEVLQCVAISSKDCAKRPSDVTV